MSKYNLKVSISPEKAYELVKDRQNADLVHEEWIKISEDKKIGTLIFEKYYFRTKNMAALIVIIDNIKGHTDIRVVSTGSSQDLLFKVDWGASENFAYSVKKILDIYILEENRI